MTLPPLSVLALTATIAVGACAPQAEVTTGKAAEPDYLGIQTVLLDDDLVSFRIAVAGGAGASEIEGYARCAAAQYALIRGFGFARHVRTIVAKSGDVTRGDAVWLISAALPEGLKTIDAEVTVRDCGELGIPTV